MEIPQPPSMSLSPSLSPIAATSGDVETEIEPLTHVQPITTRTHPTPPLTNSMLNRNQLPPPIAFPYGKCNKNHAPGTGALVLDGCGEFIPSQPSYMICDACGCHRSYHRNDSAHSYQLAHDVQCPPNHHQIHHPQASLPSRLAANTQDSPSPAPISTSYFPPPPHMFIPYNPCLPPHPTNNNHPYCTGKKRFRSKFTKDQKAKMQEFAGNIGWKMQNKDEQIILQFCNEVGVTKNVFKVWMHNHQNVSVGNKHRDNKTNEIGNGGSSS